ncbi:MAG: AAA family ATPase [Pseudomonadota bacterium]
MYTSFFGLKENPFNLTPDPRYLFLSPYHREALDHLLYGINERKGFIVVTGGIGTGKTTLCRALLTQLVESTKSALILNSFISDMEILEIINHEFGIEMASTGGSKKDHIDALNHFLLEIFSSGGNALLVIDEAQNLSNAVLEQIRMISNLETEKEKLIQIVLVGQPELKDLLSSTSLRQLNERITVRYDLRSLDFRDIQGYVEHRLVVAGSQGNLRFTKGALKGIYAHSQGNPRRINAVCDRALLIAYSKEQHTISSGTVKEAIKDISGHPGTRRLLPWMPRAIQVAFLSVMVFFLAFGAYSWLSSKVPETTKAIDHKEKPPEPIAKKEPVIDPKGLYDRARVFHKKGSLADAKRLYLLTLEIDPGYVDALNNLGVIYIQEKDYPAALNILDKATRLRPGYVDPYYNVACVYAIKGELAQSIAHLKKAVSIYRPAIDWARKDTDLKNLWGSPEFEKITQK